MSHASDITRRAKSNLAIALRLLPADRREDAVVFYAFCRTIDDIADDATTPIATRAAALDAWERGINHGFENPGEFQREVIDLRDRRQLPTHLLTAIIHGCKSDLEPSRRFQTWDNDLETYTWNVACAVGHVCIRLFGCTDLPAAERYATALGHALQLTNILRDVGEDLDQGRVYLPLEDLAASGYSDADLQNRVHDGRFVQAAELTAARAEMFFQLAEREFPQADRAALRPARVMAGIYQELLRIIRQNNFRVLDKRHKVPKTRQLAILAKHIAG